MCMCLSGTVIHNHGTRLPFLLFITSSHPSLSIPPFRLKGVCLICLLAHLYTLMRASSAFWSVDKNMTLHCKFRHNMSPSRFGLFSAAAAVVCKKWGCDQRRWVGNWACIVMQALFRSLATLTVRGNLNITRVSSLCHNFTEPYMMSLDHLFVQPTV